MWVVLGIADGVEKSVATVELNRMARMHGAPVGVRML